MRWVTILILSLITSGWLVAQEKKGLDSTRNNYQGFEQEWLKNYNQFVSRHDSGFLQFVRRHEENFKVFIENLIPRDKPSKQPVINSETGELEFTTPDSSILRQHEQQFRIFMDTAPERNDMNIYESGKTISFYGRTTGNDISRVDFGIYDASETSFKAFCKFYINDKTLQNNKVELNKIILDLKLDNFGNFLLVRKAVSLIFGNLREQTLFTALYLRATLRKDIIIGYEADNFYCLARFDKQVYGQNTIVVNRQKYHMLLMNGQKAPDSLSGYYALGQEPDLTPITLAIASWPKLNDKVATRYYPFNGDTLKINTNLFLIEYLKDYPATDLQVYFNAPLSEMALRTLDKALKPLLANKQPIEQVQTLLAFFHGSFVYKNDFEQFGQEKYMFSDESLYYPYTDCEDRAVLFSKLVTRYTGLPVIGLEYSKHVAVAVCFPVPDGKPIIFKNRKYYICDPTIRKLKIGDEMPPYFSKILNIIEINPMVTK
jgi:hypothetical protein